MQCTFWIARKSKLSFIITCKVERLTITWKISYSTNILYQNDCKKVLNIHFYTKPPKGFLKILVHFSYTRMYAKTNLMYFLKNHVFQFFIWQYINLTLKSYNMIISQYKIFSMLSSQMFQARILHMFFLDHVEKIISNNIHTYLHTYIHSFELFDQY